MNQFSETLLVLLTENKINQNLSLKIMIKWIPIVLKSILKYQKIINPWVICNKALLNLMKIIKIVQQSYNKVSKLKRQQTYNEEHKIRTQNPKWIKYQ